MGGPIHVGGIMTDNPASCPMAHLDNKENCQRLILDGRR